ncbi:MAG: dihydropteroate synthase [Bdellovibrionales bacterium]|jgi:dihydropteroate synthase|nr:dihydropteroate synthase [Bdellovibrionales bacterium]MBT3525047.1 dihydropteroate synthase [Bdellovibrionales bacterium]MBT7669386.1 dihydropteroate synthase [Bdellovibrionales bacterium]MBT7767727.1 dihydropteroate synthase [Bdellovibrionales bacterium]
MVKEAIRVMIPSLLDLSKITSMGVINITPDSFSDGGRFNTVSTFTQRVDALINSGAAMIDVGAQSTAPSSEPISAKIELQRLEEILISYLESNDWPAQTVLSIDTFRPDTFVTLYRKISEINSTIQLAWNDISGILDQRLAEVLLKDAPNCYYILGHSGVTDREDSANHLNYLVESKDMFLTVSDHFKSARSFFNQHGVESRVIYDPCLGFSKSYHANWQLIDGMEQLLQVIAPSPLLMGLSRKSFLRERLVPVVGPRDVSRKELIELSEYLHFSIISGWSNRCDSFAAPLILRVHQPFLVNIATSFGDYSK